MRRYAIKLLTKLIATHPFGLIHGGTLKRSDWTTRLEAVDAELNSLIVPVEQMAGNLPPGNETVDTELLDDATDDGNNEDGGNAENAEDAEDAKDAKDAEGAENAENAEDTENGQKKEKPTILASEPGPNDTEAITRLQLTRRYYVEAIRFIDTIHAASEVALQLLSAKAKSEVIEAMDFFKSLDVHKVETSKVRMLPFFPASLIKMLIWGYDSPAY